MKTVLASIDIVVLFIAIYLGLLSLSGWLIMLASNIVLEWMDKKTMTFFVGCATAFLLSAIGGVINQVRSKD
jgi:hypothetical protein